MNIVNVIVICTLVLVLGLIPSIVLAGVYEEGKNAISRFFRLAASPVIVAGQAAYQGIRALGNTIDDLIEGLSYKTEHNQHADTRSRVWLILGPLIYLALITPMLIVEFIVGSMRIGAVIGFPVRVSANLDAMAGAAWVLTAATWGAVVLDSLGITPISRPFHNASPKTRRVIIVIAITAIVATLLTGGLLYWIGETNSQGHPHPQLEGLFVFAFAVLLLGATAMAGWAIFAGTAAVIAVGLMIARLITRAFFIIAKVLTKTIDAAKDVLVAVLAFVATPGRRVWNVMADSKVGRRWNLRPIAPFTAAEPIDADITDPAIPSMPYQPSTVTKEVTAMSHYLRYRRTTGLLAISNGAVFTRAASRVLASSGAVDDILLYGALNTHSPNQSEPAFYPPNGVPNLTATDAEAQAIRAMSPDDRTAEIGLAELLGDKVVDACRSVNLADPHLIIATDGRGTQSHEAEVLETLARRIKAFLPEAQITVVVVLPDMARRDARLSEGLQSLVDLQTEGCVGGTLVLDPKAPFAAGHGTEKLVEGTAVALSACILAHLHDPHSPTAAETLGLLFRDAPFAGVRLASYPVTMGSSTDGVSRASNGRLPGPNQGQLADVVSAGVAARAALGGAVAAGVRQPMDTSQPSLEVTAVPLREDDPRFLAYVRNARIASSNEMSEQVFAGFNGVALNETNSGFYLTVAALFPLTEPVAGVGGVSLPAATAVEHAREDPGETAVMPGVMQH